MPTVPRSTRPKWMAERKEHSWSKSANGAVYNKKLYRKQVALHKAQNSLCVECLKDGIRTPVEATDHIVPIRDGGEVYDQTNWQSLCKRHHLIKTNAETAARRKGGGTVHP